MDPQPHLRRVEVGPFEVDLAEGVLRKNGNALKLQEQPLQILAALLEQPGQIVTREQLRRRLWPEDTFVEFDDSLNHAIQKLREAFGDSAQTPSYIETVPRRGYRFIAPVEAVRTLAHGWRRYWQIGIAAAAVVLLAVGAAFYLRRPYPITEKDEILLADFVNTTGDTTFNGTLKTAVAVKLDESPFLSIVPEARARQILRMMQKPDEKVVGTVAQEACRRLNVKAVLNSSIEKIGGQYVVTLEAVNCQDGETLARQQEEAASREKVLQALGRATSQLRGKLGESIRSVKKYDTPLEQATTSSLEALQAFSLGEAEYRTFKYKEAVTFYVHATQLDPSFALAYQRLCWCYNELRERQRSIDNAQKAYDLRERASEREKYHIDAHFHGLVTGELHKTITLYRLYTQSYPRDFLAYNTLGAIYRSLGRHEEALQEFLQSAQVNAPPAIWAFGAAATYDRLNRFQDVNNVLQEAFDKKYIAWASYGEAYAAAFAAGNTAAMRLWEERSRGTPAEQWIRMRQAEASAFRGQLRQARKLYLEGVQLLGLAQHGTMAKDWMVAQALTESEFGNRRQARALVTRAQQRSSEAAIVLARNGDRPGAESIAEELARLRPKDTFVQEARLPTIRAAIELQDDRAAAAIENLRGVRQYELGEGFETLYVEPFTYVPMYLRGYAYLRTGAAGEAVAEFQKILDHRGLDPTSPLYPLAYVGLGRAHALAGDTEKSRVAYEAFFGLWKNADPDIPILKRAKTEYGQLRHR